jgi:hypothetical protein
MSKQHDGAEISKDVLGTTKMSKCCEILEILMNRKLENKQILNIEDLLNSYNEKKRKNVGDHYKNISLNYFSPNILILKKLEFIEGLTLTPTGKRVASHCVNGEWDAFVSLMFFKSLYSHSPIFRDLVKKIRDGNSNFDQIIGEITQLHGLNETAGPGFKSWAKALNFFYKSGNMIKIDPEFEEKALELLLMKDLEQIVTSLCGYEKSIQENNLYSDLDLFFSKGTLSKETLEKIVIKLVNNDYLIMNRGKHGINSVSIKIPFTLENITLFGYLSN